MALPLFFCKKKSMTKWMSENGTSREAIVSKNKCTEKVTNKRTKWVSTSLLELLIGAKIGHRKTDRQTWAVHRVALKLKIESQINSISKFLVPKKFDVQNFWSKNIDFVKKIGF